MAPEATVGGQAVIEGVMMRAPTGWAVAVRTPEGDIDAQSHELPRLSSRSVWARVPLIRGVMVLVESLTLGYKALSWSAVKAGGEEEKPITKGEIVGSMAIALIFGLGLFLLLPVLVSGWLVGEESSLLFNATEGLLRLVIFVAYIWAIGRSKEIKRVFEYHGAEHMSIHAYEAGEPLSVESVSRHRPEHPRCGTSFLLLVVLLSILVFSFLGTPDWPILISSRILGVPVIAGISYEILRFSGLSGQEWLAGIIAAPGLWLQRLTTGVPEDDQIEVAITSLLSALEDEQVAELEVRGSIPEIALSSRARRPAV
ncbi:MAG: DUF1385 domain-containing protein [Acidimicrobiia bacterium]|nr:DUF1385 domain-containing protein [Acidimicrobiia bacterium]